MVFLNSSILFGLIAVLIPVIIHLFNLRKVKKVEFSTLMFLKDIRKSKFKRIRIKQLLLLLIRILIIASIVFAFSNPVIIGYHGVNSGNTQKSGIIILDDSYSMDMKEEKGSVLEKSKNAVRDILSQFNESDNVTFLLSSKLMQKDFRLMQYPLSKILDTLEIANYGYKVFYYSEITALADRLSLIDKNIPNEYFIISDFRKPNIQSDDNLLTVKPKNAILYLINTANREGNNISLDEAVLKSKILESGSNVKISLKVTNHSPNTVYNKIIRLFADDKLSQEIAIDINKNESKYTEFYFKPSKSGEIKCRFELNRDVYSQDEFNQDNIYYFVVSIPEVINTVILGDYNSDSYRYIRLAINAANSFNSDSSGKSKIIINVENTNPMNPGVKSDVLIINDKKSFSDGERNLIKNYLTEGKGVLLFSSKDLDVNNYNQLFVSLNVFTFSNPVYISEENIPKTVFKKIDYSHPVFEGIFKKENATNELSNYELESPQINMYWNILPDLNTYPLITLSDNSIFLSESNVQKGKLIFCSVSANIDMSKFPMTGLFPTVLIRSLQHLYSDINENTDFKIGKTNIISLNDFKKLDYFMTPDNKKIPYQVTLENTEKENKKIKNYFNFPYSSFSQNPGFYTFYDSALNKSTVIALNPDVKESDPGKLDSKEIKGYFEKLGFENIKYFDKSENIKTEIDNARKGLELWKYFLLLALLLITAEVIYSRRVEKS